MLVAGLIGTSACLVALLWSFATAPRWFARSIHRYRLWELRDSLVDDILDGRLPCSHPAVKQLRSITEFAVASNIRHLDLIISAWAQRPLSSQTQEWLREESALLAPDGLTDEQAGCVLAYQSQFLKLVVGSLLLGSWIGLIEVFRAIPRARSLDRATRAAEPPAREQASPMRGYCRKWGEDDDGAFQQWRTIVGGAADIAAESSRPGRRLARLINEQPISRHLAGVH